MMYSRKSLRALFGIRLHINDKSTTVDFRGTVFYKGEAVPQDQFKVIRFNEKHNN